MSSAGKASMRPAPREMGRLPTSAREKSNNGDTLDGIASPTCHLSRLYRDAAVVVDLISENVFGNCLVERKKHTAPVAFRKNVYETIQQLQSDLDQWIAHYNNERPHSGRYSYGKTPWRPSTLPSPSPKKRCSTTPYRQWQIR
ncbi:MAG: hypothetical protein CMJ58_02435 [Planctomycetaceae bacterium]|nr:hypothetical protein [Planctomycetaceae bacterium]